MVFFIGYVTGGISVGLLALAVRSVRRALRVWDEESGYAQPLTEEG